MVADAVSRMAVVEPDLGRPKPSSASTWQARRAWPLRRPLLIKLGDRDSSVLV